MLTEDGATVRHELPARALNIALIVLQAIALAGLGLLLFPHIARWHTLDLSIYYNYSLQLLQGATPYRDFAIEYPPFALVPFTLPRLGAPRALLGFADYVLRFLFVNVLLCSVIALAIDWLASRRFAGRAPWIALAFYAALVAVCAPLLPWRYDIFPAALAALAVLCVLRDRPAWAGVWAGLGIAAKLYPVVFVPIFGLYYLAGRDWRALLRMLAGCVLAVMLCTLPFLFTAQASLFTFLKYHSLRGLQLESLPAGVIVLLHALGLTPAQLAFNYGALHIASPWSAAILAWLPVAFLALFGLVSAGAWGRFREEYAAGGRVAPETLIAYLFAALLAFIATNKVFSPQYIIWLLPFAPLLRPRQALLVLAIAAITIFLFPYNYKELMAMQWQPVELLNVRNLLVVLLFGWQLIERAPASARSVVPWLVAGRPQVAR
jgi:uncharacterized membrane protein